MAINFTISGNPVSSKNSRPIYINKSTGARFIGKSRALKDYMDKGLGELKDEISYGAVIDSAGNGVYIKFVRTDKCEAMSIPITAPVEITFTFYVKDKRNYDLCNMCQAPLDLLKMANIIEDDNYKIVPSLDGSRIYIDKLNPRTEIEIKIL